MQIKNIQLRFLLIITAMLSSGLADDYCIKCEDKASQPCPPRSQSFIDACPKTKSVLGVILTICPAEGTCQSDPYCNKQAVNYKGCVATKDNPPPGCTPNSAGTLPCGDHSYYLQCDETSRDHCVITIHDNGPCPFDDCTTPSN